MLCLKVSENPSCPTHICRLSTGPTFSYVFLLFLLFQFCSYFFLFFAQNLLLFLLFGFQNNIKELGSLTMDFCPRFWQKLIKHNFIVFHFCLLLLPLNSLKHLNWVLLVHVFRANNSIFRPLFLTKMRKISEFWLFNQKYNISTAQPHKIFHFIGFFVQMSFK